MPWHGENTKEGYVVGDIGQVHRCVGAASVSSWGLEPIKQVACMAVIGSRFISIIERFNTHMTEKMIHNHSRIPSRNQIIVSEMPTFFFVCWGGNGAPGSKNRLAIIT